MEELYTGMAQTLFPQRPAAAAPVPAPDLRGVDAALRHRQAGHPLRPGAARLHEALRETEFAVFRQVVASGGAGRGLCVPGGAEFSRKQIDELTTSCSSSAPRASSRWRSSAKASIDTLTEEDMRSPVAKFFTVEQARSMARIAGAKRGDWC